VLSKCSNPDGFKQLKNFSANPPVWYTGPILKIMNNDSQIELTKNLQIRKKKPLWVLEMIWRKTINIIPNQNPSGKQKAPSHTSPY